MTPEISAWQSGGYVVTSRSRIITIVDMNLIELVNVRDLTRTGAARSIRIGAGLSLEELARDIGVSASTVHRWENGERVPHGEAAIAYGRCLTGLAARSARRPAVSIRELEPVTAA